MHRQTYYSLPMAAAFFLALTSTASVQGLGWQEHSDVQYGHRYEIPSGMFEQTEGEPGMLVFEEVDGGGARIMIYSGDVPADTTLDEFEARVKRADWISDVTYRVSGKSWFVLSGHYRTKGNQDGPLIFYTKFMLSPDRTRYSAIEITYQPSRKREFDPIVTRIEKALRPPT